MKTLYGIMTVFRDDPTWKNGNKLTKRILIRTALIVWNVNKH